MLKFNHLSRKLLPFLSPDGRELKSLSNLMSATSKSVDSRFAGRSYIDDPEVYKARVAYANQLKEDGFSHKFAWWKSFQRYPRTYEDDQTLIAKGNFKTVEAPGAPEGDTEDSSDVHL